MVFKSEKEWNRNILIRKKMELPVRQNSGAHIGASLRFLLQLWSIFHDGSQVVILHQENGGIVVSLDVAFRGMLFLLDGNLLFLFTEF